MGDKTDKKISPKQVVQSNSPLYLCLFYKRPMIISVNLISDLLSNVPSTPPQLRGFFGQLICHLVPSLVNMCHRDGVKKDPEMMYLSQKSRQCVRMTMSMFIEPICHKKGIPKYLNGVAIFFPSKNQKESKAL